MSQAHTQSYKHTHEHSQKLLKHSENNASEIIRQKWEIRYINAKNPNNYFLSNTKEHLGDQLHQVDKASHLRQSWRVKLQLYLLNAN